MKMSVKCNRGLPNLKGVFSSSDDGAPREKRSAEALVKIALLRKYTTLDQIRDLINENDPFQAMDDQPDEIEFDTLNASATIEQMAVRLSVTRAGATGVVFKRDHVEYGLLKASDGRLILFIPPDTVRSMTLLGIGAEDFPFPANDVCEYTCYSPSPLRLSDKEVQEEDNGKGKEEAADWGLLQATTKTVPAVMVPTVTTVPVPQASAAAVAKVAVTNKVPVAPASSSANLSAASLLPSDGDEDEEEGSVKEEKPTPTKKRPVREKRESSADHSEERKTKTAAPSAAKKPTLSAKPTAPTTVTGKTAEAAAAAATATMHAKIQTRK